MSVINFVGKVLPSNQNTEDHTLTLSMNKALLVLTGIHQEKTIKYYIIYSCWKVLVSTNSE